MHPDYQWHIRRRDIRITRDLLLETTEFEDIQKRQKIAAVERTITCDTPVAATVAAYNRTSVIGGANNGAILVSSATVRRKSFIRKARKMMSEPAIAIPRRETCRGSKRLRPSSSTLKNCYIYRVLGVGVGNFLTASVFRSEGRIYPFSIM